MARFSMVGQHGLFSTGVPLLHYYDKPSYIGLGILIPVGSWPG